MYNVLAAILASSAFATAAASETSRPTPRPNCTSDAMLVFDASGSMAASDFPDGAPNRIDRVRLALSRFLPRVSAARNLGLIVYGPGSHPNACDNIELRFKPIPNAGPRIQSEVERLMPYGMTPLTRSVERAAAALGEPGQAATIVVLTDGDETCRRDPCKLARELHDGRPNTVVHIIGYKLQSLDGTPPISGAKCLADETGGLNLTADTTDELVEAFEKTLGCEQITSDSNAAGKSSIK